VAEIGDVIELRGPIGGHFVWDVNDGGPLLLLGGGSGVVPLMSMLRHRAAVMSDVPALLLFSSRTFEDVIFRDELRALDARNDGFQLALTLTRDKPRRLTVSGGASMPPWSPSLSAGCPRRRGMSSCVAETHSSKPQRKA
jgi:ferredoxin-NADP reductase